LVEEHAGEGGDGDVAVGAVGVAGGERAADGDDVFDAGLVGDEVDAGDLGADDVGRDGGERGGGEEQSACEQAAYGEQGEDFHDRVRIGLFGGGGGGVERDEPAGGAGIDVEVIAGDAL